MSSGEFPATGTASSSWKREEWSRHGGSPTPGKDRRTEKGAEGAECEPNEPDHAARIRLDTEGQSAPGDPAKCHEMNHLQAV